MAVYLRGRHSWGLFFLGLRSSQEIERHRPTSHTESLFWRNESWLAHSALLQSMCRTQCGEVQTLDSGSLSPSHSWVASSKIFPWRQARTLCTQILQLSEKLFLNDGFLEGLTGGPTGNKNQNQTQFKFKKEKTHRMWMSKGYNTTLWTSEMFLSSAQ